MIVKTRRRRHAGAAQGRRPRRARRRGLLADAPLQRPATPSASASSSCPTPTRSTSSAPRAPSSPSSPRRSRPALKYQIAFDPTDGGARVDPRGAEHARSRRSSSSSSSSSSSCRAGAHAHPGDHHPGLADRHVRLRQGCSASRSTRYPVRARRSRPASSSTTPSSSSRTSSATSTRQRSRRARPPRSAMGEVTGAVIATSLVLDRRLRAGRVLPGHHRPPLPAVLAHHRVLGRALGVQRAHAHAGARRRCCSATRRAEALLLLPRGQPARSAGSPTRYQRMLALLAAPPVLIGAPVPRRPRRHRLGLRDACRPAFVPDEDQGYFIISRPGAAGGVARRTRRPSPSRSRTILAQQPEVEGVFAVSGFSFAGTGAEQGDHLRAALKPVGERKGDEHSAQALVDRLRGPLFGIPGALVIPFLPPAIQGVGNVRRLPVRARGPRRRHHRERWRAATFGVIGAANKDPASRGVFSGFTADDPQLVVDDRPREGQEPRRPARPDRRRAAGLHGLGLRQRLRLQQPLVPRLRAGRPRSSAPSRATSGSSTCARTRGR